MVYVYEVQARAACRRVDRGIMPEGGRDNEEGIMRAEQAVTRISRDYIRYAKKMAGIKNSMDRAEELLLAREEAEEKGRQKGITEERLEIARKMKKAGRPLSEIEEFTGLQTADYAD